MFTQKCLIAALVLGGCSIPASAALTTYTSLSTFEAATSGDTFSNISFTQGSLGTSTSDLGVVFSTDGSGLTGETNISGWPAGSALVSSANSGGNTLTITLPTAVDAISLYIGLTTTDNSVQISVADNGGGAPDTFSASPTVTITSPYFLGIVTNSSFSSFTIETFGSSDHSGIDAMEIAQAQTPEVATLLLVGTGLLVMGYFRRRRFSRRKAALRQALSPVTA
jgi:hypothetical protein